MAELSDYYDDFDDMDEEQKEDDDPTIGRFAYQGSPEPFEFNFILATDSLDDTLYPHHIMISLLQGPCKSELKLELIDRRMD